jgi:flagellar protein FlgJ
LAVPLQSDLVLDVVRAADPAAADAAREKLAAHAAARNAGAEFSIAGAGDIQPPAPPGNPRSDIFMKFEALVLQTFLQSMLPKDTESVYGEGLAGEMWHSMMAEQLANQLAEAGGIGIAERILNNYYNKDDQQGASAAETTSETDTDVQALKSAALLDEIQRTIAQAVSQDRSATATAEI